MTTGEKIRSKRKAMGLSMADLGEKVGLTAAAISRYELSQREPKVETLIKIAEVLGVTVSYLLGEERRKFNLQLFAADHKGEVLSAMDKLNADGQAVAVERVQELTEIPKYQRKPEE